ncbi:GRB10-interacting GYF protein 2-like isoform X3 [Hydractinia symbiolongicarpus]|uniref:GRB10-interacting GYF protein 2-like isoform X3 n=1 Tax=Hydractinia symbiolongicarpus TaxID=13093 RepID=UPI00254BC8FB|nr:GRB10-interacting GYF protein 2-like isoform X3 [Hydractinia symbiolongicarpus]
MAIPCRKAGVVVFDCSKNARPMMSSLTFGPQWVRDLSSGDSGAAAPPNTPPPRKYKLAEFRYGREEMLALLSEDYEIPLGLKEFEDIINERPVAPLAFIPVSEEEERCLIGGVNSLLVLKMTGRGGPGMRGRGGMRGGRGRGRGDYSLHRSVSSTDDTYGQRSWADSSLSRGGFHRPVGRGESLEGGTSRPGYDSRARLSSEGAYPARPGEYWRSNSQEPAAATTPGEDEWRQTLANKPWTGKKGSADNNRNWRDAKDNQVHESLTRTKSWSRMQNNAESDLPEWCMDDSVDGSMPGSFDASGQFRAFKEKGNGDENDKASELVEDAFEDEKEQEPQNNDSKNELNGTKTSENKDTKTKSNTKEKNKIKSEPDPDKENLKVSKHSPIANNVKPPESEDKLSNEQEKNEKYQQPQQNNTSQNTTQMPSSEHKTIDEDYELNLDHITSMVAKLDDESDEEERVNKGVPSHALASQNSSVDPSIVFAKKAEPGKSINGLHDWIYRDPQGEIQGPFNNDEMLEWFKAGYFTMGLQVRRVCDEMFLPLGDVIKLWSRVPFLAKSQPPPITNQMLLQHQQAQQNQLQQQTQLQQQNQLQQQTQLQRLLQQQQQQQMRQALLKQLQVQPDGRPQDLGLPAELSVWGDSSNNATPSSVASPWTPTQEQNAWSLRKSPQNALSLRQIEEDQQRQIQSNGMKEERDADNKSPKEEEEGNVSDGAQKEKQQEAEQKNREKEELQRKALEALKQQQQFQQQQKIAEQQRLLAEQNRREEEIRLKQHQQQQQQMQQHLLYQKYQQEQQRKQQQQQQQQSMASTWSRVSASNSAPSLAEIQRLQERKEAELQEHMKAIQQHELMQQQKRALAASWAQHQGYQQQQQQKVKSLIDIQAEEAKKVMQQQHIKQQHQLKQQQQQARQQQQGYNSLPWNAAGQPIHAKPNKPDSNAMFWDDVIGLPSRVNGSMNNQPKAQQQRKAYSDFPPVSTMNKMNKRDIKEQEIVNRIFQAPTPSSDFVNWVERNLPAVKRAIDVPTVVSFLQDIESPYEIHEYMRTYLGDSKEQKEFVREFLERRNKTDPNQQSAKKLPGKVMDNKQSAAGTPDDDGFEDVKKNKKKKKMQKVNPNLLGFQCNAAPEILNREGEVESVATAVAKGKK